MSLPEFLTKFLKNNPPAIVPVLLKIKNRYDGNDWHDRNECPAVICSAGQINRFFFFKNPAVQSDSFCNQNYDLQIYPS